jgi:MraZ protein
MFGGSFTHKLDEVGRFIVPRKFRMSLGEPFVITRGIDCLLVMTADRFNEIYRQAQALGNPLTVLFDPEARRLHHQLFSEMIEAKVDGQGRVQLTPELRAYAGIDKDLVMIGVGDWLEIWGLERWQAYKEKSLTADQLVQAAAQSRERKEGGEASAAVSPSGPAR